MKKSYSIAEARDHLAAIVHDAESGTPVRITRRGRPVAVLLSDAQFGRLQKNRPPFWDAVQAFRDSLDARDLDAAGEALRDMRPPGGGRDVAL